MTKYLFIYHAPDDPGGGRAARPPSRWRPSWASGTRGPAKVGDGMVDFGTPLAGGVRVTPDGTSPSTREVVGLLASSRPPTSTPPSTLAQGHPHLNMPGGCEIEVHEAQAVPGM